ncbi:MAG: hypothetical protein CEO12_79 [Parcubacteria group bacterium Gr01-1014_46]|nr:MAG: hypothetical protein CEO12_79 [Parcubacteria group bacterium Gr01-1014_46]
MSRQVREPLATNTVEVTGELTEEITESLRRMRRDLDLLEGHVLRRGHFDALSRGWVENVDKSWRSIVTNVDRINGAILIRSTK